MGCFPSREQTAKLFEYFSKNELSAKEKSRAIDEEIEKNAKAEAASLKLLLLGSGESGKSTIIKQLKIIYHKGFTSQEMVEFIPVIRTNIVQSMKIVLQAMYNRDVHFTNPETRLHARQFFIINTHNPQAVFEKSLVDNLVELYKDTAIQECIARPVGFTLNDSASYYFENLERIVHPNYFPNTKDVLRTRIRTTGVNEYKFSLNEQRFKIVDVGGQRSERKKWIRCFENITAIIYCAAISEYDMFTDENDNIYENRLLESLNLFKTIYGNPIFSNTSFILFLNKKDLFKKKIERVPLSVCFPEYPGGNNYEESAAYIQSQFESVIDEADLKKDIYTSFTCATDTFSMRFVLSSVTEIIIASNLRSVGLF